MKMRVSILLLAAMVYITETIFVPSRMAVDQKAMITCALDMNAPGMHEQAPCHQCRHTRGSADGGKQHSQNNGHGDCNDTANCMSCPMCYTATLSPFYHATTIAFTGKPDYQIIPDGRISDYHATSWKPPDAAWS